MSAMSSHDSLVLLRAPNDVGIYQTDINEPIAKWSPVTLFFLAMAKKKFDESKELQITMRRYMSIIVRYVVILVLTFHIPRFQR